MKINILKKFKKSIKTDNEFIKNAENVFLSKFDEKFGKKESVVPVFSYVLRGLATSFAAFLLLFSTSVYADQKNVGPKNALYPLKRISEGLRASIASNDEKANIFSELAERRLNEAQVIAKEEPSSPEIAKLTNEAKSEIQKSFAIIENVSEKILTKDVSRSSEPKYERYLPDYIKKLKKPKEKPTTLDKSENINTQPLETQTNLQEKNTMQVFQTAPIEKNELETEKTENLSNETENVFIKDQNRPFPTGLKTESYESETVPIKPVQIPAPTTRQIEKTVNKIKEAKTSTCKTFEKLTVNEITQIHNLVKEDTEFLNKIREFCE